MEKQLALIPGRTPDWHIDRRTREAARVGLAQARGEALEAAIRRAGTAA